MTLRKLPLAGLRHQEDMQHTACLSEHDIVVTQSSGLLHSRSWLHSHKLPLPDAFDV